MRTLSSHRTVANVGSIEWIRLEQPGLPDDRVWWHNISYDEAAGFGSYFYKMSPGARSNPHQHLGPEEFFVLEGDLVDCDGHVYEEGDFVSLDAGSKHDSVSPSGCTLLVTHRGVVRNVKKGDL